VWQHRGKGVCGRQGSRRNRPRNGPDASQRCCAAVRPHHGAFDKGTVFLCAATKVLGGMVGGLSCGASKITRSAGRHCSRKRHRPEPTGAENGLGEASALQFSFLGNKGVSRLTSAALRVFTVGTSKTKSLKSVTVTVTSGSGIASKRYVKRYSDVPRYGIQIRYSYYYCSSSVVVGANRPS
jgi:hypothetical protein